MKTQVTLKSSYFFLLICLFILSGCKSPEDKCSTLRLNLYCDPPTLDPRKASDITSIQVVSALFEGLTRFHFDNLPQFALAKSIEFSEDRKSVRIGLKNAYWSDGKPIIAKDFVSAWKSALDPLFPSSSAYHLYLIENAQAIKEGLKPSDQLGVKILSDKEFTLQLKHPAPYLLQLFAHPIFFPLPSHLDQKKQEIDEGHLICNGPFIIEKWNRSHFLSLKKNRHYWDQKSVQLKNIHFFMMDDSSTELSLYENGQLDWAGSPLSNLPFEAVKIYQNHPELNTYPVCGTYFYKLNTSRPPLNNQWIRKALSYAIDRTTLVTFLLDDTQTVAYSFVPVIENWDDVPCFSSSAQACNFYFEKGLKELQLTRESFPILSISYNANREHQRVAEFIQQEWKQKLGISSQLDRNDWQTHLAKLSSLQYEVGKSAWLADYLDPYSFLEIFKNKGISGAFNETDWEDESYQKLLELSFEQNSLKKRYEFLKKAEILLLDEMPIIPLYYLTYAYLKKPQLKNVYLSPLGSIDFKWAYKEESCK